MSQVGVSEFDDGATPASTSGLPARERVRSEWDENGMGGATVKGASLPLPCAPMTSVNQVDSTVECRRGDRTQLLVQLVLCLDPFG